MLPANYLSVFSFPSISMYYYTSSLILLELLLQQQLQLIGGDVLEVYLHIDVVKEFLKDLRLR